MYYINYILRKNYFRNIKIKNISKKQLSNYSYSQYGGGDGNGGGNGGGNENYFFIPLILASFYYFSKK
jgi:hypothetical protein